MIHPNRRRDGRRTGSLLRSGGTGPLRGDGFGGPDGLLSGLTKTVLEAGLEAKMSEHLGYDRHDPAGKNTGNSRKAPDRRRC